MSGGRKLQSPVGSTTRPTTSFVREAVMNLLAPRITDSSWLDLCSGSGVMSCEALQHGVKVVVAVEISPKVAKVCRTNLASTSAALGTKAYISMFCDDVIKWLSKEKKKLFGLASFPKFDLVYLDPPYDSDLYETVLNLLLKGDWLSEGSLVICEHSTNNEINVPAPWVEADRRKYGNTSLLMLSPPVSCPCDTGSMQPQKGQAM